MLKTGLIVFVLLYSFRVCYAQNCSVPFVTAGLIKAHSGKYVEAIKNVTGEAPVLFMYPLIKESCV
jgi:hypothetical protein